MFADNLRLLDYLAPALSARNGKLLWEMDLEGAVLSAPVVA